MKKEMQGYTLIELVISITLISIAVLGVLLAVNTAAIYSGDPMISYQSVAIAEAYLSEIATKGFPPTGSCPSAVARAVYTNICNYNGLNQVPTDQTGSAIAGLGSYTVQVNVDSTTAALGALTAGTQAVRVDVIVAHPMMNTLTFSLYRTNY